MCPLTHRVIVVWVPAAGPCTAIPEIAAAKASGTKLLWVVEEWLRGEKVERQKRTQAVKQQLVEQGRDPAEAIQPPSCSPFDMPSRHMAFFR
jgi:hypothetical protein